MSEKQKIPSIKDIDKMREELKEFIRIINDPNEPKNRKEIAQKGIADFQVIYESFGTIVSEFKKEMDKWKS